MLQQPLAAERLDFPAFERALQQFVNTAERLRGTLNADNEDEGEEDIDAEDAPAALQPPGGFIRG